MDSSNVIDQAGCRGTKRPRAPTGKQTSGRTVSSLPAANRRVARTCRHPDCGKNPYFGWYGQKAIFCVAHKEEGMVDVKNKRCEAPACLKRGLFGFDGQRARFCGGHRYEGMVDLKNKRCKHVGCAKQATFANPGKNTASLCSDHRTPEMVDVKGRRCDQISCTRQAVFGLRNEKPRFCAHHKNRDMIDVRPRLQARRNSGEAPSGVLSDAAGSGIGNDHKRTDCSAEGPTSFASKWGKRTRKSRVDLVGERIDGLSIGNVDARGVSNLPGTAGSHVDLLRPARRASPPPFNNGHAWDSAGGMSPGVGNQANSASLRPFWSLGRTQTLGSSLGYSTPTVGMWGLSGNQVSSSSSTSHWDSHSADKSGTNGSGVSVQSSPQWTQSAYEAGFSSSFADDSTYTASGYDSSIGGVPPIMVRSCSSLPVHTLSGASGGTGRFSVSSYASGESVEGNARVNLSGEDQGNGGGWRSSLPGPGVFAEPFQSSAGMLAGIDTHGSDLLPLPTDSGSASVGASHSRISGNTAPVGVNNSAASRARDLGPVSSMCVDESVGRSTSSRAKGDQNHPGNIPEVETEDGWLRDLMQGAMARENGGLEMQADQLAGDVAGCGANVGYPSPTIQRALPAHATPLQNVSRQRAFLSNEQQSMRSGTVSGLQPLLSQQRLGSGGDATLHGVLSSAARETSVPVTPIEASISLHLSDNSVCSSTSSSSSRTINGTMVRSPSTASNGATPPDEYTGDCDVAISRWRRALRRSEEGVGGGVGNPAGGGGSSPGFGGDGSHVRSGSPGGGPSMNQLFVNISASNYNGAPGIFGPASTQPLPTASPPSTTI